MLLPALSKARQKARDISCINNKKTIGVGFALYHDDYSGFYPYNAANANEAGGNHGTSTAFDVAGNIVKSLWLEINGGTYSAMQRWAVNECPSLISQPINSAYKLLNGQLLNGLVLYNTTSSSIMIDSIKSPSSKVVMMCNIVEDGKQTESIYFRPFYSDNSGTISGTTSHTLARSGVHRGGGAMGFLYADGHANDEKQTFWMNGGTLNQTPFNPNAN